MPIEVSDNGRSGETGRGDVSVCIPVHGAPEMLAECLRAVLRHTDSHIPILIADDASADPEIRRQVDVAAEADGNHRLRYARQERQLGFVGNCNSAFDLLDPADVVLLNSDCLVAEGWLDSLRSAAAADPRIATVTALSNSATILSVPSRNLPAPNLPQDWTLEAAAEAVRRSSSRLLPRIPTAVGHCVYIRRSALELVGGFDDAFAPGYEEEVDFSQRCLKHGLYHVVADDCFVLHYGGATFGTNSAARELKRRHHQLLVERYRYFDEWVREVQEEENAPLARSLNTARRALDRPTLTVDGRILTKFLTGTQIHALELITGLDATGDMEIRVIVPADLGNYAARQLAGLQNVSLHPANEPVHDKTDIVHRPFQISSAADLVLLREWGRQVVVTHQDLIAYNSPSYFATYGEWRDHRRLTHQSLAIADHVVFFSRHAASEALAAELVEPHRLTVVHLGTDHQLDLRSPAPELPRGAQRLAGQPFLLCIGTDFTHKNRLFAIRLLESLVAEHSWDGLLVFAGPRVTRGSSAGLEAAYLGARPELDKRVIDVAAVDDAGKAWLMSNASAVVYPTVIEGFGLVPFEAADAGLPCFFAHQSALAELFPSSAATLVPWCPSHSAARVRPLLEEGTARDEHVRLLRAAGAPLTWKRTAEQLLGIYTDVLRAPVREASRLALDHAMLDEDRATLRVRVRELDVALARARAKAGEIPHLLERIKQLDARHLTLVEIETDESRHAFISNTPPFDAELRKVLLAIGYRRWLSALLLGPLRRSFRIGRALRPRRRTAQDRAEAKR